MQMLKLIQNETIKTFKKTSTKILIILSIVMLFLALGLANMISALSGYANNFMTDNDENWKEVMNEQIASMQKTIEIEGMHYDRETLADLKAEKETYEIALRNNVNYSFYGIYNTWKNELLNEIMSAKKDIILGKENGQDTKEQESFVNERISLLESNDFEKYIDFKKDDVKNNFDSKKISKEEYEDKMYLLDLRKKYDIYKEQESVFDWKGSLYSDIEQMRNNLRTGINSQTGKLLSIEEVQDLEDSIKISEYRLEHNVGTLGSGNSTRNLYDTFSPAFALLMISLLIIIVAGSSVSTEVSKGTIKFLLFTPNKRWKVLLSKIISAVLILVCLSLILSVLSVVIGNIFCKDAGHTFIYVQNGEVKELSNLAYTVLYFLASSIDILVYLIFALTLSVLTRNTALSVGVSIAAYIGSGTIMSLINSFITADWVKFIPFNNFGVVDRIFASNLSYSAMQAASGAMNNVSVGFSLAVLGVCAVLMLITMFDSFNKRDIV